MMKDKNLNLKNVVQFKTKDTGRFSGYASTFNTINCYDSRVIKGAFEETAKLIKSQIGLGKPLKLLWSHNAEDIPVGYIDVLFEDDTGLFVEGCLDIENNQEAKSLYSCLKNGTVDAMSIGAYVIDYEIADDGICNLTQLDLREISLCNFPADDNARVSIVCSVGSDTEKEKYNKILLTRKIEKGMRDADIPQSLAKKYASEICHTMFSGVKQCDADKNEVQISEISLNKDKQMSDEIVENKAVEQPETENLSAFNDKFEELKVQNDNLKAEFAEKVADLSVKLENSEAKVVDLTTKLANISNRNSFKGEKMELQENKEQLVNFLRTHADTKKEITLASGTIGTLANGGYGVETVIAPEIIKALSNNNIMRQLCDVQTVSSRDTRFNVDVGGTSTGWVGETADRDNTDSPLLAQRTIAWGELYANPKASQRLLNDAAFDVEAWYRDSVSDAFASAEEDCFLNGVYSADVKPKGLLTNTFVATADATRADGSFQFVEGALSYDSILALFYSLKAKYRGNNCSFLMGTGAIEALRKVKNTNGDYVWVDNISNGMSGALLGVPVYESAYMPAVATGAYSVLFGDFKKAFKIIDINGLNIIRDPYTAKGQVSFYTSKEVGTLVGDTCALKALKISA